MRRKLVAGNWKMHGSLADNEVRLKALVAGLSGAQTCDVAVFASMPYLFQCEQLLSASVIEWGAQTVSEFEQGAYTGETSVSMLRDFACRYALVGHSERRALFHETDEQVASKFKAAASAGIVPVLCVGETLEQREAGDTQTVISAQVEAVLNRVGVTEFAKGVIAYEPVWAIGTGRTATPEQAQSVHCAIRAQLNDASPELAQNMKILYGGSVKPDNAAAIFEQQDVDGALVGGASLQADDFIAICNAAG